MKTLSKLHIDAIEKAKTDLGKVNAAALALTKILIDRSVLEQALEALENAWLDASMGKGDVARHTKAINALRAALAEQPAEQEPVAWVNPDDMLDSTTSFRWIKTGPFTQPVYTTPQPAIPPGYKLVPVEPTQEMVDTAKQPLNADDLKEPKNGKNWRVEWWNESCRMMLPSGSMLDSFQAYKNGTLQFTIKKTGHGIAKATGEQT